ncbi:hypothetical protein C7I84_22260 [Mesorhizobium ephedrae]|uniref:Uncharacterized protein n=1 Tax=Kumtagia ephedrae TaxID=2116701 RepID=A0A2P7S053_9HYPH|nr:hypothetical protein C7I84_22260 [Mesorhizobium ephedrae]
MLQEADQAQVCRDGTGGHKSVSAAILPATTSEGADGSDHVDDDVEPVEGRRQPRSLPFAGYGDVQRQIVLARIETDAYPEQPFPVAKTLLEGFLDFPGLVHRVFHAGPTQLS